MQPHLLKFQKKEELLACQGHGSRLDDGVSISASAIGAAGL